MDKMDDFVELQAILAGLPMHAVPQSGNSLRTCGPDMLGCTDRRRHLLPRHHNIQRVEKALEQACVLYPRHSEVLGRLVVEHVSLDVVCLADHVRNHLFTATRGTDKNMNSLTTPRDVNNDILILLGLEPCRTAKVLSEYRELRERFPDYDSFGSGHSLGGNIMQHLAKSVEISDELRFRRIDVFNAGATPLRPTPAGLEWTELHVHRVVGDWASWFVRQPVSGRLHSHSPNPHCHRSRHSLQHFLPYHPEGLLQDVREEQESLLGEQHQEPQEESSPPSSMKEGLWSMFSFMSLSCAGMRKCAGRRLSAQQQLCRRACSNPAESVDSAVDVTLAPMPATVNAPQRCPTSAAAAAPETEAEMPMDDGYASEDEDEGDEDDSSHAGEALVAPRENAEPQRP
eukprot:gnl/TRDRNA2_/TRDRNA2_35781_c0_seq1.p1 gnl/TRDRNA2_/TRDRNA2_35781_c0~~gnl/TRDRNA2_/TRDRNA2_35781_c0_seq1.p1  ORF type:complete len:400 (+),score=61.35 gnl/TRDRNA2_/TRDRNA2_35781_c0_seq1:40-1239(+)